MGNIDNIRPSCVSSSLDPQRRYLISYLISVLLHFFNNQKLHLFDIFCPLSEAASSSRICRFLKAHLMPVLLIDMLVFLLILPESKTVS